MSGRRSTTDDAPPGRLAAAVADLFPGYFALVMATGIVSIAAHLLGWHAARVRRSSRSTCVAYAVARRC